MADVAVGIDCINLIHEILIFADILPRRSFRGYDTGLGRDQITDKLKRCLKHVLHVEEVEAPSFGDVVIFKTGKRAGHCAFYDDESFPETPKIWHAMAGKRVMASDFVEWKGEVDCILRLVERGWKNDPQNAIKL
jgi:hypothetical protein